MLSRIPVGWREKLGRLKDDIERALTRWFRRVRQGRAPELESVPSIWPASSAWPPLEMRDETDRIVVTAELPGLEPEALQVELSGDALVLRGEKRREREKRRDDFLYSECVYGAFARWIPLPVPVVVEKASARFRNGRLIVELPKRTPARRIPVTAR